MTDPNESIPLPDAVSGETLWTVPDVAKYFGCTPRHVVNLQANGLPYFYIGRLVRFDPAEVRDYLRSHRRLGPGVARRRARSTGGAGAVLS